MFVFGICLCCIMFDLFECFIASAATIDNYKPIHLPYYLKLHCYLTSGETVTKY